MAAGLASINLLLVTFILPESLSAERRAQIAAAPAKGSTSRTRLDARLPRVGPLMWVRIVIGFTFAMFEGGFSLWAANSLGLTAARIGLVLGYVGVISVTSSSGSRPAHQAVQRRELIVRATPWPA